MGSSAHSRQLDLSHWGATCLFVGICSLFTGLELKSSLLLKPFDFICLLVSPPLLATLVSRGKMPRCLGLALFVLFTAVQVFSAAAISFFNFVREAIQALELITFAAIISYYRADLDWRRMMGIFLLVALLITAFNGYWHVANGFWVGWKRLDEPKLLFSLALPVFFAWMMWRRASAGPIEFLLIGLVAILLVLSGERKAQVAFLISILIATLAKFFSFKALVIGALIAVVPVSMLIGSDEYLFRQFNSISTITEAREMSLSQLLALDSELTQSNAQREFALRVSETLIPQHFWFGLGTNGFQAYVEAKYSDLPPHMLLGIHNEFLRVLVENGVVGLVLYVTPWVRTIVLGLLLLPVLGATRGAIYFMFVVVFFSQCFFEGSGTEAYLTFLFMAILPDLFRAASEARLRSAYRNESSYLAPGEAGRLASPARTIP